MLCDPSNNTSWEYPFCCYSTRTEQSDRNSCIPWVLVLWKYIWQFLETDPQGTSFAVIMLLALQDLVHAPWPNGKDRLSCYADHTLSQKGRYSFLTLADQSTEPGIYPDGGRRTEHLSSKLHNHNASRVRMNRTSQSSTTGFRVFHKFPARIYWAQGSQAGTMVTAPRFALLVSLTKNRRVLVISPRSRTYIAWKLFHLNISLFSGYPIGTLWSSALAESCIVCARNCAPWKTFSLDQAGAFGHYLMVDVEPCFALLSRIQFWSDHEPECGASLVKVDPKANLGVSMWSLVCVKITEVPMFSSSAWLDPNVTEKFFHRKPFSEQLQKMREDQHRQLHSLLSCCWNVMDDWA